MSKNQTYQKGMKKLAQEIMAVPINYEGSIYNWAVQVYKNIYGCHPKEITESLKKKPSFHCATAYCKNNHLEKNIYCSEHNKLQDNATCDEYDSGFQRKENV